MSLLAKLGLVPPPDSTVAKAVAGSPLGAAGATDSAQPPDLKAPVAARPGDLELTSFSIKPGDMTVDGDAELHFSAQGTDEIGDPVDLTYDVEWSTSNDSAVSIDRNGVAHAHPVSGKAKITAIHEPSGRSASSVLTVTYREPLGPKLPPKPKPAPELASIAITTKDPQVVMGTAMALAVTGTYRDGGGQDETQAVEWESTDPAIVSVDAQGRVTGHALGEGTVTATEPNSMLTDWITVKVVAAEVTALTIDPLDVSLHLAQLQQFHLVAEYSNGVSARVDDGVSWESSATNVVSIDAGGMAMGRNPGTAHITATWATTDATGKAIWLQATTHASVPVLKSLAIDPDKAVFLVGEERAFNAIGLYSDRSRKEVAGVQWRCSDGDVLSLDRTGRATGRGEGSATVTATLAGNAKIAATTKVTVKAAPLAEVAIEAMDAKSFDGRLQVGQRLQLRATGRAPVGSGKVTSHPLSKAIWKSSDAKVAQVKDGIVRALKVGDTVVSATDGPTGLTARVPLHVVAAAAGAGPLPENFDKLPEALKAPYRDAGARYEELLAQLRALDNVPRLMATLQEIIGDIAKAGKDAVDQAEKLETQRQLVDSVGSQITLYEKLVDSAVGQLERADKAFELHERHVEVARLRQMAKNQGKVIKAMMGALKGAWKIHHHDPVGGALEVVSGALDLLVTSDYDKAADELQKTLDADTKALLQADVDGIAKELGGLRSGAAEIKELARKADAFANNLREKAQEAFDAGAKKGGFRFADIDTALAMADRVLGELVPAFRKPAGSAIALIEKAQPRAPRGSEAALLLHEMHETAIRWVAESVTITKQVQDQRAQLRKLRAEALTKLAFVKPGHAKPKKGAARP